MRKLVLSLGLLLGFFLTSGVQANAQSEKSSDKECENKAMTEAVKGDMEKSSFAVQGKCSMCEDRIEKAAKNVDGVKKAKWDQESEMLTVMHTGEKKNVDKVHKAVSKAGHDTSEKMASDESYASLPGCCKYREE